VRNADCLFTSIMRSETLAEEIAAIRAIPRPPERQAIILASGHLICRPTRKEAEDYYHYIVYEKGDWEAAEHAATNRTAGRTTPLAALQGLKERLISGLGTYPVVGSYDDVVATFKRLSECGLNGMAVGLVNYINDFPALRDEVLPRMVKQGLRCIH
jgi:FMNH2-dependent dimethyl sulfone monooxygenase